jgi:hypothetical protein
MEAAVDGDADEACLHGLHKQIRDLAAIFGAARAMQCDHHRPPAFEGRRVG